MSTAALYFSSVAFFGFRRTAFRSASRLLMIDPANDSGDNDDDADVDADGGGN